MTEEAVGLRFLRKPSPVLIEHRPLYKISQIVLILHLASRGGRSKVPRLHLFNWASRSSERRQLLTIAAKQKSLKVAAWGFDPALAIAIRYAIAEKLLREVSAGYELTDRGNSLAKDLMASKVLLESEKSFLTAVGKGISEAMVEEIASGWEA